MITFDFKTYRKELIDDQEISSYKEKLVGLKDYFKQHHDYLGWYHIDNLYDSDLILDIKKTSSHIRNNCDVFLVVGIGGSFMGASAVIDALSPYFAHRKPDIRFIGTSLSSDYFYELKEEIKNKDIIVNYVSKSKTTLETSLIYDLVMEMMAEKYNPEELEARVVHTSSAPSTGRFKNYHIPNDIGGRFSVFTPAGLLPIAVAGVDLDQLFLGAIEANKNIDHQIKYAVIRDILAKTKQVEAYVVYEPKLSNLTAWLKQLYAESLGKNKKGLLPIDIVNTRDLHSLGQFIEDGKPILFETVINVKRTKKDLYVEKYNKSLNDLNQIASNSSSTAHYEAGVVNNIIDIDELSAYNIGYLMQFFMLSCAVSGYLANVNAFDQPGVEAYKNIMRNQL